MKAKMPARNMQNRRPNSTPVTAKMKSVWASGSTRFTVPSPGPLPSQPPDTKLSTAVSTWNVSYAPGPFEGSRKWVMRSRTWGTNL